MFHGKNNVEFDETSMMTKFFNVELLIFNDCFMMNLIFVAKIVTITMMILKMLENYKNHIKNIWVGVKKDVNNSIFTYLQICLQVFLIHQEDLCIPFHQKVICEVRMGHVFSCS